MDSPWVCWTYHYGVGGLLFVASLVVAICAGALRPTHAPDRRLLVALVGGLATLMAVHAAWIASVWP